MKDPEIFTDKKFTDLLQDIHQNASKKREEIVEIIVTLKQYLKEPDTLVVVAPIIKDYLDVLIRNDEHFIKLASIVQRIITLDNGPEDGVDGLLSESEKAKLISDAMAEIKGISETKTPTLLYSPKE